MPRFQKVSVFKNQLSDIIEEDPQNCLKNISRLNSIRNLNEQS